MNLLIVDDNGLDTMKIHWAIKFFLTISPALDPIGFYIDNADYLSGHRLYMALDHLDSMDKRELVT